MGNHWFLVKYSPGIRWETWHKCREVLIHLVSNPLALSRQLSSWMFLFSILSANRTFHYCFFKRDNFSKPKGKKENFSFKNSKICDWRDCFADKSPVTVVYVHSCTSYLIFDAAAFGDLKQISRERQMLFEHPWYRAVCRDLELKKSDLKSIEWKKSDFTLRLNWCRVKSSVYLA